MDSLFSFAEPGDEEKDASEYLITLRATNEFRVTRGVTGMPAAFVAQSRAEKPVIGFIAEIGALGGSSQKPGVAWREPLIEGGPGHGEGYNAVQAVNVTVVLVVKETMESYKISGSICVYPGIAKELRASRTYMVNASAQMTNTTMQSASSPPLGPPTLVSASAEASRGHPRSRRAGVVRGRSGSGAGGAGVDERRAVGVEHRSLGDPASCGGYFENQPKDIQWKSLIPAGAKPAIEFNKEKMDRFRPALEKLRYDPSRYRSCLEQLLVDYPRLTKWLRCIVNLSGCPATESREAAEVKR